MKYYKKNKRLFNCCILLFIVYFLNTYDILTAITLKNSNYFWNVDKNMIGYLEEIIKSLNTFTYLSKGIISGVLIYLGNAYRLACENKKFDLFLLNSINVKEKYLKAWFYSGGVMASIMFIFVCFFSFYTKLRLSTILTFIIILINGFLYTIFVNEIALFLSRKIKLLGNIRYLVEVISFGTILMEIGLSRLEISLFYNTSLIYSLVMIIVNLCGYYLLKKTDCFCKKYDCIYTTYRIK